MNCSKLIQLFKQSYVWMRWANFFLLGLLVVAMLASPALASAHNPFDPPPGGGGIIDALKMLTKGFVTFLIAVAALLLAIGIVTGFLSGMIESAVGRPGGLSTTWMRLAGVVVCFIGAALTIIVANSVIDAMTGLSGGDINLPK